jgi:hypothetical protein
MKIGREKMQLRFNINCGIALMAFLFCTACVNPQLQAQMQAQTQRQQAYSYCNSLQRWIDEAQCVDNVRATDPTPQTPLDRQGEAYRHLLEEKVLSKKMTDAEARYAISNFDNQATNQVQQQNAQNQATAAMIQAAQRPVYYAPPPQPQEFHFPTAPRAVQTTCTTGF